MAIRGDTTPTVSRPGPTSVPGARGRVLILGGTAEGRELANLLVKAGYSPVTSLAGVTREPSEIEGATRIGGFGGAEGLAAYLAQERFSCLVDATHPFAVAISHHAKAAAQSCSMPMIRLERPAWHAEPGDHWIGAEDIETAAAAIPSGAHILLTIGRKEATVFLTRTDISGVARMIEPVNMELGGNWRIMLARPPFHVEKELCLLRDHSITHLVTKNSGGEDTRAKLIAARMRGIPVVMIARPVRPDVPTRADPVAVMAFVAAVVNA